MACAIDFGGLEFKTIDTPKTATNGAKITTHFIIPVKKNCNSSGVVPT
jgi:hypothetical protein